jgi:hypothetical protein
MSQEVYLPSAISLTFPPALKAPPSPVKMMTFTSGSALDSFSAWQMLSIISGVKAFFVSGLFMEIEAKGGDFRNIMSGKCILPP